MQSQFSPRINFFRIFRFFFIICLFLAIQSCSGDDPQDISEINDGPDITVIAEKNREIYEVDITGNSRSPEVNNLTQTLGVPYSYNFFESRDGLITFFLRWNNNFKVWQKDLQTRQTLQLDQMCGLDPGESIFTPKISEKYILMHTAEYIDEEILNHIHVYDKTTGACRKLFIAKGQRNANSAYIDGDHLFFYIENYPTSEILKINLITGQQEQKLSLDRYAKIYMKSESFQVLFGDGSFKSYKKIDFSTVSNGNINIAVYASSRPGIYANQFRDNQMVFDIIYAQPSRFYSAAAVVDWSTGEIVKGKDGYLFEIHKKLETEIQKSVQITSYAVDLQRDLIIIGYHTYEDGKGGLLYTNFNAEIGKTIELDVVPKKIIIR